MKKKRIEWKLIFSNASQSGFEFISKNGKYYIKTISEYCGISITRYPSESYADNELLGLNKGARARTVERT